MPDRCAVFAIPGNLDSPTGGYVYARRMLAELRAAGWRMQHLPLGEGFPNPDAATLAQTYRLIASQPRGQVLLIDGLALGVLPDIAQALGQDRPLVALVHHPLALESGMDADRARALAATEREALAAARRVVTTSRATARTLVSDYGVPADRISVAPPGTDEVAAARGSGSTVLELLSVGSLVPRKGHDLLLAALAPLRHLSWRLTVVGDAHRDSRTAGLLHAAVCESGLTDRVVFTGAVDAARLTDLYARADVFVLASRHEGFGMAYAEAIAHGLPVLGTTAGAIPEAVPSEAGLLVAPDDARALRAALQQLLTDPATRSRLSAGARLVARSQPRWPESAARLAGALEQAGR